MTPPVLPFGSLGALKGSSTAGMGHTARQVKPNRTKLANSEYSTAPSKGPPICCLLTDLGPEMAEIAASRGIKAKWMFKVERGTAAPAGTVWEVDRSRDAAPTETIESTGHVLKYGRLARWIAARDVTLNKK